ncbi:hypothetical protein NIES2101_31890 [Calothrix sp. HK-06]|nr:hypothetical protein NIES2101_31890 [Calothrix sp. HK-06]
MQPFVYIIESLRVEDIQNNQVLGKVLTQSLDFFKIPHHYGFVNSVSGFIEALTSNLYASCEARQGFPILHFIMHGSEDGVQLGNGEIITWQDLRYLLSPLVREMGNYLIICMSSCYGFSGCKMAMYFDNDFTFHSLIGNDNSLYFNDALAAYIVFYHRLFKGDAISDCVAAMNSASGDGNFRHTSSREAQDFFFQHIRQQAYDLASRRVQSATSRIANLNFLGDYSY